MSEYRFKPLTTYIEYPIEEMRNRLANFYEDVDRRRTVREFSDRPVPRDIIETALRAAGTAPSGANLQPWHFVVISGAETKKRIRAAAEKLVPGRYLLAEDIGLCVTLAAERYDAVMEV